MKRPLAYKNPTCGHILPGQKPELIEAFKLAQSYQPSPTDIFVVTYPKCGTTWMQNIVYLLKHGGRPILEGECISDFAPCIDFRGPNGLANVSSPKIIKTHQCFKTLPYNPETRYICVARNPKDCVVSLFYHTLGLPQVYGPDVDREGIFESFMDGVAEAGDYFDHLLSLYAMRHKPNVMFLTYEQLLQNPRHYIEKVANFIEPLLPAGSITPDVIDKTLQNSSFEKMKSLPHDCWLAIKMENAAFIRKGKTGSWKEELTPEQSTRIDKKLLEKLGGTDAEHLFDGYI